jgi:hypothetical protein
MNYFGFKKMISRPIFASCLLAIGLQPSNTMAAACDYRLSALIGKGSAVVAGTGRGVTSAAGNALGYYTLTNAATGASMLGSVAASTSAASEAGLVASTGSGVGAAGAALMSPIGIAIGVVLAVGVAGTEGYCYFKDERITRYQDVLAVVQSLSANADPLYFELVDPSTPLAKQAILNIGDGTGALVHYEVEFLYIVNGAMKYRAPLRDQTIGNINLDIVPATKQ